MDILESFQSAVDSIKANKLRSFLTMLGIIIGISSVITIVSIGEGGRKFMLGEFDKIGTNIINVQIKTKDNDIQSRDYFTMQDVKLIETKIPKVTGVNAIVQDFGSFKTENKSKQAQVIGATPKYAKIMNAKVIAGRFLNDHDLEANRDVIVIDDLTAKKMFNTTEVVGRRIKINVVDKNLNASIIGVIKNPEGNMAAMFGDNYPAIGIIPITISEKIMKSTNISALSVILSDMNDSKETASKIIKLLENKHQNSEKYAAQEGFAELDTINKVLNTFTAVIGAIAGISLIVGGIGVMNIMLVSVTERTREIGIRKAIGAKRRDIKIQFLTESLILCLIGGIIGMAFGIGVGQIAGKLVNVSAPISLKVILISFLFSSAVGIFFGIYPANQAAKLDPIEALRYE